MHYSKIKHFDTANGPGIRTSLFVSGCENHCEGCFNPETWNKENGDLFTEEILEELLNSIDQPYCSGLSLLGGDPLAPYNLEEVKHIVETFRKKFGFSKNIWMWTGYLFEDKVSNLLEQYGYRRVTGVKRINHKEFDVICQKDGIIYNFQCKNNFIN